MNIIKMRWHRILKQGKGGGGRFEGLLFHVSNDPNGKN